MFRNDACHDSQVCLPSRKFQVDDVLSFMYSLVLVGFLLDTVPAGSNLIQWQTSEARVVFYADTF